MASIFRRLYINKESLRSIGIFQSYSISSVTFTVKNAIIEQRFAQEFTGKVCGADPSFTVNWCYKAV